MSSALSSSSLSSSSLPERLSEIQSSLRAGIAGRASQVGPFLVALDPDTANPYRNYAVPDPDAAPTPAEVDDLVAWFAARQRRPRLEYLAPNPPVDAALAAAGFTVANRLPVMLLVAPADLVPPATPAGIDLLLAEDEPRLWSAARVQNIAYGEAEAGEADVRRLRRTVERGGRVALAVDAATGEGVGSGLCTAPTEGRSEIAAVGVRPEWRRRGIAAAVTALLCAEVHRLGMRAFLQAEGEAEQRIYRRLGFTDVGELLDVRGPEATESAPGAATAGGRRTPGSSAQLGAAR